MTGAHEVASDDRSHWRTALWAVMLLHFAFFLFIRTSWHWGYLSHINDLGVFDQVVWNSLHGDWFRTTINPFHRPINWLGFHFQPILLLFVPLYALSSSVEWFAVAQAAALALAAWPVFRLASRSFASERAGFVWALLYLMNPFLLSAAAWDFHPIVLAVPLIAMALLAVAEGRGKMLLFACLLLLTCKEHMGVMVAGFGLLWWLRQRQWKLAALLVTVGIGHLIVVVGFIMPMLSPTGTAVMLGKHLGTASRYGWLGASLAEAGQNLLMHPWLVAGQVMHMGGLLYLLLLLVPFAFVFPLLGWPLLLPGLADLAANMLSSISMPREMWAYHSVSLVPLLVAAAMAGLLRLARWQSSFSRRELTGLVAAATLVSGYLLLPLPLPGAENYWAPTHVISGPDPELPLVRAAVGRDSSLSVQANVGAHFSRRHTLYTYPARVGEVDAIVLRLESPTTKTGVAPAGVMKRQRRHSPTWLDGHLQMDRADYLASIAALLDGGRYGIVLWRAPWLVLSRKAAGVPGQPADAVRRELLRLRAAWKVDGGEYRHALADLRPAPDSGRLGEP